MSCDSAITGSTAREFCCATCAASCACQWSQWTHTIQLGAPSSSCNQPVAVVSTLLCLLTTCRASVAEQMRLISEFVTVQLSVLVSQLRQATRTQSRVTSRTMAMPSIMWWLHRLGLRVVTRNPSALCCSKIQTMHMLLSACST